MLASPMVGASLDALVVLAAEARSAGRDLWWALRDAVAQPSQALAQLPAAERDRLATFAAWFAGQRERIARASIEELIEDALSSTGYDLAMLAMPGGTRRLANVRKLMRLGREHEEARGPDLRGFLGLLADRQAGRSPENREGEAPVEGEGLDAVRLMTIHRAKGLEFEDRLRGRPRSIARLQRGDPARLGRPAGPAAGPAGRWRARVGVGVRRRWALSPPGR